MIRVKGILAELTFLQSVKEVTVGRRYDPHVRASRRRVRSHRATLSGLQEPKQQTPHARAHVPDLVEEDGAAMRPLEQADLVAMGACEAALDVVEELRFELSWRWFFMVAGDV